MKILIVGSLRYDDKYDNGKEEKIDKKFVDDNKMNFREACKSLGAAIAKRNHEIIVGVPDWKMLNSLVTVSTFIIEGVGSVESAPDSKHKVIFYGPEELEPKDKTPQIIDTLREIREKYKEKIEIDVTLLGGGASKARTIPNINAADVVILVGGRNGTESIGYAADTMEKPVVVIPYFRGAAEKIAKTVLYNKYAQLCREGYLSSNQIDDLRTYGDINDPQKISAKADNVVKVCEMLVAASNIKDRSTWNILRTTTYGIMILPGSYPS
jgi:hypothetical protein